MRAGENYCRLSRAPRSSLTESKGKDKPDGLTMRIREYLKKKGESREYLGEKGIFGQF